MIHFLIFATMHPYITIFGIWLIAKVIESVVSDIFDFFTTAIIMRYSKKKI